MGAGGSPRQCAINLKRGLPTAPISGGAEGGLSASYLSVGFLLSDSSCCLPPPLGVGGGLAGAMAVPSAIAPALGHLNYRGLYGGWAQGGGL